MKRFKLIIEYDGTNYSGWQKQNNVSTVQDTIEKALTELNKDKRIAIMGSGRTDTGVHALSQVAHFDIDTEIPARNIRLALNSKTPRDINITDCIEIDSDFHSRYDAIQREYLYKINTKYSVMNRNYTWYIKWNYNFDLLQKCAEMLIGTHDFEAFCLTSDQAKSKVCIIYKSAWKIDGNILNYSIVGNRFLHSMVRMLVGTMIYVGTGKYSLEEFKNILNKDKNRKHCFTAPARGLFLYNVNYK